MASTATEPMTAEELALLPEDGWRYELVRGKLRRKSPSSFRPSNVAARTLARIVAFADEQSLGEVTGDDGGHLVEPAPDTVRAPDAAFVRAERLPTREEQEQFAPIVPDLAVDVMSPSHRPRGVEEKVAQYLAAGVPLVWVFHSRQQTATVHRTGRSPRVLGLGETLDGEEILLGFRLPLADVFR
ncbi:MAG: Uma2 family endonuclease [Chloroflexota bacterium]|nr:Uma2 family endonuclease [Chloroflexota bacterium]